MIPTIISLKNLTPGKQQLRSEQEYMGYSIFMYILNYFKLWYFKLFGYHKYLKEYYLCNVYHPNYNNSYIWRFFIISFITRYHIKDWPKLFGLAKIDARWSKQLTSVDERLRLLHSGAAKAVRDNLNSGASDSQIDRDVDTLLKFESELAKVTTN